MCCVCERARESVRVCVCDVRVREREIMCVSCVCTHACMHVSMHMCMHACMLACSYVSYSCMHARMNACMHVSYSFIHACMCAEAHRACGHINLQNEQSPSTVSTFDAYAVYLSDDEHTTRLIKMNQVHSQSHMAIHYDSSTCSILGVYPVYLSDDEHDCSCEEHDDNEEHQRVRYVYQPVEQRPRRALYPG